MTSEDPSPLDEPDPSSADRMLVTVYAELRQLAKARIRRTSPAATLAPTELVHEAYVRLSGGSLGWATPGEFMAAAGESMRRILVDRARARGTLKRGGGRALALPDDAVAVDDGADDLEALDAALTELESRDARLALVVKLRYFAGLTAEETAAALEVGVRTVHRDWALARTWLRKRLLDGDRA